MLAALSAAAEEHVPYRPTTSGPFVTFTAPITARARLLVQPIFSMSFAHGSFDAAGRLSPGGPQDGLRTSTLSLFTEYGLTDDLSLGAQLSVAHNERLRVFSLGVGELTVFARRVVLKETGWGLPEGTLLVQVKVPTGNAEGLPANLGTDLRGSGSTDLTVGLDLTRGIRPIVIHADLLFTHPVPALIGGVDTHAGDVFSWSVSAEWPFWLDRLGAVLELSGRHQLAPTLDGVKAEGGPIDELVLGAGLAFLLSADVQILVGYQRTLWGRNAGGHDTVILTVAPVFF